MSLSWRDSPPVCTSPAGLVAVRRAWRVACPSRSSGIGGSWIEKAPERSATTCVGSPPSAHSVGMGQSPLTRQDSATTAPDTGAPGRTAPAAVGTSPGSYQGAPRRSTVKRGGVKGRTSAA